MGFMLNISQSFAEIVVNAPNNIYFRIGIDHLPGLLSLRPITLTFCKKGGEKWQIWPNS